MRNQTHGRVSRRAVITGIAAAPLAVAAAPALAQQDDAQIFALHDEWSRIRDEWLAANIAVDESYFGALAEIVSPLRIQSTVAMHAAGKRSDTMTRGEINWCYGGDDRTSRLAELKKHEARQQAALEQAGYPEMRRKAEALGEAEYAAYHRILEVPARTLDGIRIKLAIASEVGEFQKGESMEARAVTSALKELERLTRRAS